MRPWNRFTAIKTEEELGMLSSEISWVADPDPCKTTGRKHQVITMGDSLL